MASKRDYYEGNFSEDDLDRMRFDGDTLHFRLRPEQVNDPDLGKAVDASGYSRQQLGAGRSSSFPTFRFDENGRSLDYAQYELLIRHTLGEFR